MADTTPQTNQRTKEQKQQEPITIDVTTSGTHPAGNYKSEDDIQFPSIKNTEIWIEQEDQAKQGMARKFDLKHAQAAPDHPHVGHVPGSGESQ